MNKINWLMGFAALFLSGFSVNAQSAVYTWKDAGGMVHYSDKPPAPGELSRGEVDKKEIRTQGKFDSQAANQKFIDKKAQEAKAGEKGQAKQGESEDQKAARLKECELAKENIRQYSSGGRVTYVNEKGEKVFLSEAEISGKREEAIKRADEICSDPQKTNK